MDSRTIPVSLVGGPYAGSRTNLEALKDSEQDWLDKFGGMYVPYGDTGKLFVWERSASSTNRGKSK